MQGYIGPAISSAVGTVIPPRSEDQDARYHNGECNMRWFWRVCRKQWHGQTPSASGTMHQPLQRPLPFMVAPPRLSTPFTSFQGTFVHDRVSQFLIARPLASLLSATYHDSCPFGDTRRRLSIPTFGASSCWTANVLLSDRRFARHSTLNLDRSTELSASTQSQLSTAFSFSPWTDITCRPINP